MLVTIFGLNKEAFDMIVDQALNSEWKTPFIPEDIRAIITEQVKVKPSDTYMVKWEIWEMFCRWCGQPTRNLQVHEHSLNLPKILDEWRLGARHKKTGL